MGQINGSADSSTLRMDRQRAVSGRNRPDRRGLAPRTHRGEACR
jgi:hypothetical protein